MLPRIALRLPPILGGIALIYLLNRSSNSVSRWLLVAIVAQPILHLPVLAAAYQADLGNPDINWNAGPAGYSNVRVWGMHTATAFAIVVAALTSLRPRPVLTLVAFMLLSILAALLAFSGTRAGLIGLAIGVASFVTLRPKGGLYLAGLGAVALATGGLLSLSFDPPSINYGLFNSLERLTTGAEGRDITSGRLTLWIVGTTMILNHPLFGHGLDQLILFNPPGFSQHHLHNMPLQLLFDFGIVGGGSALLLLTMLWRRAIDLGRRAPEPERAAALAGLLTLIAMSPFEDILYHTDLLALTAILTTILLSRPLASIRHTH